MNRTYHLAVRWEGRHGFESYLTWVTDEQSARRFYDINRGSLPEPTALIDGTGRILVES